MALLGCSANTGCRYEPISKSTLTATTTKATHMMSAFTTPSLPDNSLSPTMRILSKYPPFVPRLLSKDECTLELDKTNLYLALGDRVIREFSHRLSYNLDHQPEWFSRIFQFKPDGVLQKRHAEAVFKVLVERLGGPSVDSSSSVYCRVLDLARRHLSHDLKNAHAEMFLDTVVMTLRAMHIPSDIERMLLELFVKIAEACISSQKERARFKWKLSHDIPQSPCSQVPGGFKIPDGLPPLRPNPNAPVGSRAMADRLNLFEYLGEETIKTFCEVLVGSMTSSVSSFAFMYSKDQAHYVKAITEYLVARLGGPVASGRVRELCSNDELRRVHSHLNITKDHADEYIEHAEKSLNECHCPANAIVLLKDLLRGMAYELVGDDGVRGALMEAYESARLGILDLASIGTETTIQVKGVSDADSDAPPQDKLALKRTCVKPVVEDRHRVLAHRGEKLTAPPHETSAQVIARLRRENEKLMNEQQKEHERALQDIQDRLAKMVQDQDARHKEEIAAIQARHEEVVVGLQNEILVLKAQVKAASYEKNSRQWASNHASAGPDSPVLKLAVPSSAQRQQVKAVSPAAPVKFRPASAPSAAETSAAAPAAKAISKELPQHTPQRPRCMTAADKSYPFDRTNLYQILGEETIVGISRAFYTRVYASPKWFASQFPPGTRGYELSVHNQSTYFIERFGGPSKDSRSALHCHQDALRLRHGEFTIHAEHAELWLDMMFDVLFEMPIHPVVIHHIAPFFIDLAADFIGSSRRNQFHYNKHVPKLTERLQNAKPLV